MGFCKGQILPQRGRQHNFAAQLLEQPTFLMLSRYASYQVLENSFNLMCSLIFYGEIPLGGFAISLNFNLNWMAKAVQYQTLTFLPSTSLYFHLHDLFLSFHLCFASQMISHNGFYHKFEKLQVHLHFRSLRNHPIQIIISLPHHPQCCADCLFA